MKQSLLIAIGIVGALCFIHGAYLVIIGFTADTDSLMGAARRMEAQTTAPIQLLAGIVAAGIIAICMTISAEHLATRNRLIGRQ